MASVCRVPGRKSMPAMSRWDEPARHEMRPAVRRILVDVAGVVQGVGFRPFVYREAVRLGLSGFVRNTSGGVEIEVEGSQDSLDALVRTIECQPPPIAQVNRIEIKHVPAIHEQEFRVIESAVKDEAAALISPDLATCQDCLQELRDPRNRRYRYPFTNCTHCGPRFTITKAVPYDRERTTMRRFRFCPLCAQEYWDPLDRRYHAEPNACSACGPRVMLLESSGQRLAAEDQAVQSARARLAAGQVVAVKGLGGFHLACDATNQEAVARLRHRKGRLDKPLALMCRDLEVAREYCQLSTAEARELTGPRRPILLLRKRDAPAGELPAIARLVAPGHGDLGVMLPYTPLHHLLLEPEGPACLVMTSGNRSAEPMATANEEAVAKLGGIADALLVHNRPIWNRCDDSVGYFSAGRLVLLRRSRGYTPLPVELSCDVRPTLALGGMMSNVFALAAERRAFLSQHIGDVDNLETLDFLRQSIGKFTQWLDLEPEIVAHDMHPDLLTTHLAHELAKGCQRVAVQHHHAHLATALAAAGVTGEAQGIVLDGTGWGPDRTVWGGELFVGCAARVVRTGHLRVLPLPGGEAAIRRPLRLAVAYLHVLVPEAAKAPLDLWRRARPEEAALLRRMVDRGFNTPLTSSAGRLFDAVAALLGVRDVVSYEGQAAVELEQLARHGRVARGPVLDMNIARQDDRLVLDPEPLLAGLVDGLLGGADRADLALGFHAALAETLAAACARVRDSGGPATVALCGGVFQNRILTRLTAQSLETAGLAPIRPGIIPINDGGLALGQVLVANAAIRAGLPTRCGAANPTVVSAGEWKT